MCSSGALKVKQEKASDSVTEMQVIRRREPEHFLLKVESFSESKLEIYKSDEFEAGGYKWRLILYPNGDKERNGNNHISLYLSICDTQNLPSGWEVEADFCLFVYNSLIQRYQTYKLADKTWFNWLKTESGFAQLMPLDEFKETSNGYLFGDACVFGAEVYVTGYRVIPKRQTLSMKKDTITVDSDTDNKANIFTWTLRNFSTSNCKFLVSKSFIRKDMSWNLFLYPRGNQEGKDKSISVYLELADDELKKLAEGCKVNAVFKLRIRNQLHTNHVEEHDVCMFSYSEGSCSGYDNFMLLSDVHDKSKGYLENDTLIVEVEFVNVQIIDVNVDID